MLIPNKKIQKRIMETIFSLKDILNKSNNRRKIMSFFYSEYKDFFYLSEGGNVINIENKKIKKKK